MSNLEPCNCKCPCHKEEEKRDELVEILGEYYSERGCLVAGGHCYISKLIRVWIKKCWDMAWTSTGFDHTKFKILLGIE